MSFDRINELKIELDSIHAAQDQFIRESEGAREWTPMDDREMAVITELTSLIFAAEWTPEVTSARKAQWNAWVQSAQAKGAVSHPMVVAQETAQGWKLADLKRALSACRSCERTPSDGGDYRTAAKPLQI